MQRLLLASSCTLSQVAQTVPVRRRGAAEVSEMRPGVWPQPLVKHAALCTSLRSLKAGNPRLKWVMFVLMRFHCSAGPSTALLLQLQRADGSQSQHVYPCLLLSSQLTSCVCCTQELQAPAWLLPRGPALGSRTGRVLPAPAPAWARLRPWRCSWRSSSRPWTKLQVCPQHPRRHAVKHARPVLHACGWEIMLHTAHA